MFDDSSIPTLKLYFDDPWRHLASFLVVSVMFIIHRSTSWSIWIVNCHLSRYGLNSRTNHVTVSNLLRVASYDLSALFIKPDQYFTRLTGQSSRSCNEMHPINLAHTFLSPIKLFSVVVTPSIVVTTIYVVVFRAARLFSRSHV